MGKALIEAQQILLVEAEDVQSELDDEELLLIDTREPEAFQKGHLPRAVNLPPSSMEWSVRLPDGKEIHHLLAPVQRLVPLISILGVSRCSRIVAYDDGEGYTAARVFWILDYYGHPDLRLLNGGLSAWRSFGRPLSSTDTIRQRGDFTPKPNPGKIADYSVVQAASGRGGIGLVNTLPYGFFRKEAIPGSVNIPYTSIYRSRDSHRLLEPDQLDELFRQSGITPELDVITYCGIGYTASQLYFAARVLGYPRVRLYDGSLTDWKARGGRLEPGR